MTKFCFIFLYKTTMAKLYAIIKTSRTATEVHMMAKIDHHYTHITHQNTLF